MRLERLRSADPWVRLAVAAWLIALAAICGRCALKPRSRTLYTTWAGAGHDWVIRRDLYRNTWEWHQDQFRYSPLVAVLLVPFSYLPEGLGGVMWRLLNAAVLLGGFAWWLRAAAPRRTTPREQAALFLLMLPLSLGSINNGQPNPLVIGLLLAAAAAIGRDRWNLAAVCVMLAVALKVYPLAVALLLAAAYPRRFAPRLLLAVLAGLAVPFLCQHGHYVRAQYGLWVHKLVADDDRKGWPTHMAYRDLWLLLRVCKVKISPRTYTILQLASAAVTALLCLAARRRGVDRPRLLLAVLALGGGWMTLVGPATESCTYVLIAPFLAWAVLTADPRPWQRWRVSAGGQPWPALVRRLPAVSWVLFLLTVLAGLSPGPPGPPDTVHHPLKVVVNAVWHGWPPATNQVHALGLHPLAGLLLTAAYAVVILRTLWPADPAATAADAAAPARAA
jgi:hypothetical protein